MWKLVCFTKFENSKQAHCTQSIDARAGKLRAMCFCQGQLLRTHFQMPSIIMCTLGYKWHKSQVSDSYTIYFESLFLSKTIIFNNYYRKGKNMHFGVCTTFRPCLAKFKNAKWFCFVSLRKMQQASYNCYHEYALSQFWLKTGWNYKSLRSYMWHTNEALQNSAFFLWGCWMLLKIFMNDLIFSLKKKQKQKQTKKKKNAKMCFTCKLSCPTLHAKFCIYYWMFYLYQLPQHVSCII